MISNYNPQRQKDLERFFSEVYKHMNFSWEPEGKDQDIRNISSLYLNYGGFWVATYGLDNIIGSIGLRFNQKEYAELKRFYVLPNYHGQGIGYILLKTLLEEAKQKPIQYIRLDTTTKSMIAIKLFKELGFYEIERYNNDPFAELFYEKSLK